MKLKNVYFYAQLALEHKDIKPARSALCTSSSTAVAVAPDSSWMQPSRENIYVRDAMQQSRETNYVRDADIASDLPSVRVHIKVKNTIQL